MRASPAGHVRALRASALRASALLSLLTLTSALPLGAQESGGSVRGVGSLDALMRPRAGRIAHSSSADPRQQNDDFAPAVGVTGLVSFGQVELRAGVNRVELEIVGEDARLQGYPNGYLMGLDGFLLRR